MSRRGRRRPSEADREAARQASEVARRAIRRLDILEWVIFAGGAVMATAGGALVAWLLATLGDWDFRSTWIGASLLLFVVAGGAAIIQIRRDERADRRRHQGSEPDDG